MQPGRRVAVDVGGTFIDLVSFDPATGALTIEKQPASADRLPEEMVAGLRRLAAPVGEIAQLLHGSTVALNAILQERGATVGLVTTAGFRDTLELGRGARLHIYDWLFTPPDPLVPRHLRREVKERTAADGVEIVPLDLEELDREVDLLLGSGADAIAICFLHAYADPRHEREALARIAGRHPDLPVSTSSTVASEWREYERTSTTVLNAFVRPSFAGYLDALTAKLRQEGYGTPFAVMQSNGGVIGSERAAALPIRTLMSGPAGGTIGGRDLADQLGLANVICADVGGTSFDVSLVQDGEIVERSETTYGGRPVLAPVVDIASIGAGGGSIVWIDETGSPRVGPQSAGATPGPACFGLGGVDPTVTDCQLLLGRLDPDTFLGSRMHLDLAAARTALGRIADELGMDLLEAAAGAVTIAEIAMGQAIHVMTVERGVDPRVFTMLAYGGGGGLFAASVADELAIPRVVVPRSPANFSAWGILMSDYREDASRTHVRPLRPDTAEAIVGDLEELRTQVTRELEAYGFTAQELRSAFTLDLRFDGQEHTIGVPLDPDWTADPGVLAERGIARFTAMHRQLFGHGDAAAPVEVVTARCRGTGVVERPAWPSWPSGEPGAATRVRPVTFGGGEPVETPVFARDQLAAGQRVEGPAVVEEWTSTVLVPPGWTAATDAIGDLVLERA
jgi:N-methylhydantoinase A